MAEELTDAQFAQRAAEVAMQRMADRLNEIPQLNPRLWEDHRKTAPPGQ